MSELVWRYDLRKQIELQISELSKLQEEPERDFYWGAEKAMDELRKLWAAFYPEEPLK